MIQAISTEVKVNLAVSVILQKYSNFIGSARDDFDSEETSIMLIGANKPLVIHVIYVHAAAFSCDVLQKCIVSWLYNQYICANKSTIQYTEIEIDKTTDFFDCQLF